MPLRTDLALHSCCRHNQVPRPTVMVLSLDDPLFHLLVPPRSQIHSGIATGSGSPTRTRRVFRPEAETRRRSCTAAYAISLGTSSSVACRRELISEDTGFQCLILSSCRRGEFKEIVVVMKLHCQPTAILWRSEESTHSLRRALDRAAALR